MAWISPAILSLRRDPRLLKLPPYLSAICSLVGVIWLLLLPLNKYSRYTYISENALLPGQVHTYFGGSEQNIFRAYQHEVESLADKEQNEVVDKLEDIFKSAGLRPARQQYEYISSGQSTSGENIYSILHAPRGDATEAIVLVAAWKNADGKLNRSAVALLLTLARYFKRWSLWSKDIIFLIPGDSWAGPQAWADAYHDVHSSGTVSTLPLKSGALQGVVAIDFPFSHRFESIHIVYDGINGQLPNLDLVNTAASIASGQMGIPASIQQMWKRNNGYEARLKTMLRGMFRQGLGHASGPHSSFIPYHIDAITLQAVGEGWQDEMAMGRTVESIFRSLNNLLEHFHQSFFFYLLMQPNRFVSIGTYLPSAMLLAGNFTIMAIALWIQSGRTSSEEEGTQQDDGNEKRTKELVEVVKEGDSAAVVLPSALTVVERKMFLPLVVVVGAHLMGLLPLYIFNHSSADNILSRFTIFSIINAILPYIVTHLLITQFQPTPQQYQLMKSFSMLLLGLFLSALATLNFSLSFLIGQFCVPWSFAPVPSTVIPVSSSPSSSTSSSSSSKVNSKPMKKDQPPPTKTTLKKKKKTKYALINHWIRQFLFLNIFSPPAIIFLYTYFVPNQINPNPQIHNQMDILHHPFPFENYSSSSLKDVLVRSSFAWHVWRVWTPLVIWCVWWPAWLVGGILSWARLWESLI